MSKEKKTEELYKSNQQKCFIISIIEKSYKQYDKIGNFNS